MADAYRRFSNSGGIGVAVTVDLIGHPGRVGHRESKQQAPLLTLALTIAAAALAWMAVSAPDFIEQGLFEGS